MKRGRILTDSEAAEACRTIRAGGGTIVFTNGCFDILHRGHIHVLERAASMGDVLVVGINTDDGVRRLKGPSRPLQGLEDRALLLASLRMVDIVVPFDEDTPLRLIETLLPDVLVKGGDYDRDSVAGADVVRSHGGRVEIVELVPGCSSTGLIRMLSRASTGE